MDLGKVTASLPPGLKAWAMPGEVIYPSFFFILNYMFFYYIMLFFTYPQTYKDYH